MSSLEELFCHVDDFCQAFEPVWHRQLLTHNLKTRQRERSLCLSEIMTILIASIKITIATSKPTMSIMSVSTGNRRFRPS